MFSDYFLLIIVFPFATFKMFPGVQNVLFITQDVPLIPEKSCIWMVLFTGF